MLCDVDDLPLSIEEDENSLCGELMSIDSVPEKDVDVELRSNSELVECLGVIPVAILSEKANVRPKLRLLLLTGDIRLPCESSHDFFIISGTLVDVDLYISFLLLYLLSY